MHKSFNVDYFRKYYKWIMKKRQHLKKGDNLFGMKLKKSLCTERNITTIREKVEAQKYCGERLTWWSQKLMNLPYSTSSFIGRKSNHDFLYAIMIFIFVTLVKVFIINDQIWYSHLWKLKKVCIINYHIHFCGNYRHSFGSTRKIPTQIEFHASIIIFKLR